MFYTLPTTYINTQNCFYSMTVMMMMVRISRICEDTRRMIPFSLFLPLKLCMVWVSLYANGWKGWKNLTFGFFFRFRELTRKNIWERVFYIMKIWIRTSCFSFMFLPPPQNRMHWRDALRFVGFVVDLSYWLWSPWSSFGTAGITPVYWAVFRLSICFPKLQFHCVTFVHHFHFHTWIFL